MIGIQSYIKKVDHYLFLKEIKKGASSTIFLALDDRNNNLYAIKLIPKIELRKDDNKVKINREIINLYKLSHDNIIRIKEYKLTEKNIYLITEYCNGGNLSDFQKYYKNKYKIQLNELFIQKAIKQIASGLEHMHENNIIHRDIKLENILINFNKYQNIAIKGNIPQLVNYSDITLNDSFTLKISDLRNSKEIEKSNITNTVLGTPKIMSPDIMGISMGTSENKPYDNKVDLWSLGVITYELLTGQPPFLGNDIKEIYKQIMEGKFKFPGNLIASIEIITFINGLLQYSPEKRLDWSKIKNHDFLTKNVKDFTFIELKCLKESDKDEIEINIKNRINLLWILFKSKNSKISFDKINFFNLNESQKNDIKKNLKEDIINNKDNIKKVLEDEKMKIKEEKIRLNKEKNDAEKLIKEAEDIKREASIIIENNEKLKSKLKIEEKKMKEIEKKEEENNSEKKDKIKLHIDKNRNEIKDIEKSQIENNKKLLEAEKLLNNAKIIINNVEKQINDISENNNQNKINLNKDEINNNDKQENKIKKEKKYDNENTINEEIDKKNYSIKDIDDWVIYDDKKELKNSIYPDNNKNEKNIFKEFENIEHFKENEKKDSIVNIKIHL